LAALLSSVLLIGTISSLIGCANQSDSSTQTSNSTLQGNSTSESSYDTDLPSDLNFDDTEIVFAYVEGGNGNFTHRSLEPLDTTDNVDAAVSDRNNKIESKLGVEITTYRASESFSGLRSAISTVMASDDGEYDVIVGYQYFDIGMASQGYLLNISNLIDNNGNSLDYINLSKPYWSSDYIDSISYQDCVYWLTGDLSLRYLGGMYCTFVNAKLYESLYDSYGSIYDIVKSGNWTLDMLSEMGAKVYQDTNGNDTTDEGDIMGFVLETTMDPIDGVAFGCNVQWSQKNDDGSISIIFGSDHTVNFWNKFVSNISSTRMFYSPEGSDSKNQMTLFASGSALFTVASVYQAEVYLKEMENYYIIPSPKLDTTQESYVTGIHDGCTLFGIAWNAPHIAAAAATLEMMASLSSQDVASKYYDGALKYSYTTDAESAEMIDLIRSCVNTDFVAAWSQSINDIVHFFRGKSDSKQISRYFTRSDSVWNASLTDLLDALEEYSTNDI
jgi:hypothetical protein